MRRRVLELNASNERGIDVVRKFVVPPSATRSVYLFVFLFLIASCSLHLGEKVKAFAQVAVSSKEKHAYVFGRFASLWLICTRAEVFRALLSK